RDYPPGLAVIPVSWSTERRFGLRVVFGRTLGIEVLDTDTGKLQLSVRLDKHTNIWFVANGRQLLTHERQEEQQEPGFFRKIWEFFSPPPTNVAGLPEKVHLYDTETGQRIFTRSCAGACMSYPSPDGRSIVIVQDDTATKGSIVECWDVPANQPLRWS